MEDAINVKEIKNFNTIIDLKRADITRSEDERWEIKPYKTLKAMLLKINWFGTS